MTLAPSTASRAAIWSSVTKPPQCYDRDHMGRKFSQGHSTTLFPGQEFVSYTKTRLGNGRVSRAVSALHRLPIVWQLRRSRSSREPVVIYCQLPAIEIQLLRNGPEVEDSIVDIVVTGLESLSERDVTRGAATDRRVVHSRCRRAIDVTGTFVLIRSDVPASTVRQQGRYTMADGTTTDQVTGPGWLTVGDAGCFGDPMFSGEVLVAMATAARAGTTITQALADANITTSRDKLEMRMVRLLGGDFWSAYNPIATALRANKQWDTFTPFTPVFGCPVCPEARRSGPRRTSRRRDVNNRRPSPPAPLPAVHL
jgi:hypothetical protein